MAGLLAALLLLGLATVLVAALMAALPAAARAQEPVAPVYRLSAEADLSRHTIRGELELELDAADPRLGSVLWLHLPPNRFLEEDPRGRRRRVDSLEFATGFETTNQRFDSVWPAGFSPGRIVIERIDTAGGTALPFELAPNPRIPQGYSVRDGLLRVDLAGAGGARRFRIQFVTELPRRYWDGWSDAGLLLEAWFPMLASYGPDGWDFDPATPRAGRYGAELTFTASGQVFLGHGWTATVEPGTPVRMPLDNDPLRVFPLVFIKRAPAAERHDYDISVYSYHQAGSARLGGLALEVARRFLGYVRREYRLPPPQTRIVIVEVAAPPGDIRTLGSLVLVPRVYYKNTPLLDRVFVAQLSRAVAQVWFGESVWSNRDTQSWLHLGLSGYLALDFFNSQFGWDAAVHTVVDWLQPRYREHFFEAPVRSLMRGERDAALMISLRRYPYERTAMIVAHNKAPLVLRSLHYVVGQEAFARGLNALYFRHRYSEVTVDDLRREMSLQAGRDLQPFFSEWFFGAPRVDFAVEALAQEPTLTGHRVRVAVRRTGPPLLPVDVQVVTESGGVFVQRWEADGERAELIFLLPEPAAGASIDPDEVWMEIDRKNNYSQLRYRVRPLFDWPKQREVLVALSGVAGGNSIDGNYLGIGVNISPNEDHRVRLIPIYGERTGLSNYQARWTKQHLLVAPMDFDLTLQKLGGTTLQSLSLTYRVLETDDYRLLPSLDVTAETVTAASFVDRDGTVFTQLPGRANRLGVGLEFERLPGRYFGSLVELEVVDSRPSYQSDFEYTASSALLRETLTLGSSHLFALDLFRGTTVGTPPLQKRFELSGPEGVSGYPRILELTNEEVALAGLEYGYVISRSIVGSAAQLRRTTVFLFADAGRGWNNGEARDLRPQRQSAGVGIELLINLLRLTEFPLRVDVAYPFNDKEYRDPQIILFGLLTF